MGINDQIKVKVLSTILPMLSNTSDENIIRVMNIAAKFSGKVEKRVIEILIDLIKKKHPTYYLIKRILEGTDQKCLKKLVENLILRGFIENDKFKEDNMDKIDNWAPKTLLISPSMRCNLRCVGCYADRYSKEDDLSYEDLDRVIGQARDMKVGFITILGGEPFIRKDLFDIFKKYNDCYFQVYSNGTLITEELCEKLKEVGNVILQISIEGYEKETDERRGKGTWNAIMKAMALLKKHKIPFGTSICVTNKNQELVFSDEFIDMLIDKGAFMSWYFLFMPVCGDPDMSLMPTPDQRLNMLNRGKIIRDTKPLFIIDFWNDAPYVGGCIAGKEYAHVTSTGDVEPCIFTHFSVSNIKEVSLKEAFNSEYFKDLRKKQPYNENLYMPCQWIDNPEVSRELYAKHDLKPTHKGADDILTNDKNKKIIDKYAAEIKEKFKEPWEKIKKEAEKKD